MKKIVINNDNRRFNISSIVVGYLEENKEEVLEFEIPEKYAEYGKKACFSANGQTFAKTFDDVISNKLTITRDISQFKELDMTIEFFKIENEDEIVARTSILHILIENAIVCDDDIKPDEPKIIILDNLIDEVTKLDVLVTKNEKKREEYYQEIQKKVDNGDFDGATFTPSVDTDGNIRWSNDKNLSNPTTQNIKGPKGPKGDTYNLTEQDKKDISSITVESSESMFNQYYNGKLEDFNSNATSKTNDYNTNATNKTTEYNNNATSKVNEFNTNTDTKLQEYNTNADNKIAEYDLHSQELNNKIIDTRNELERVKNDVLETGTDIDTFVHLEDSAMAEYQELSVDGVCEQETTSGKNLFPIDKSKFPVSSTNLTAVLNNDGAIQITGIKSESDWENIVVPRITELELKKGKTYTTNLNLGLYTKSNHTWVGNKSGTFTPDEDWITSNSYWATNKTGNINKKIYPMVVEATTLGNYEPYTGGQPSPSPDYPQEIKTIENSLSVTSCNKNLFDKNNEDMFLKHITIGSSGLITSVTTDTSQPNYIKSIIIKCKPDTRYSISKLASATFCISDSEEIPYVNYQTRLVIYNNALSTYSFTTSKSAKYIIFKFYNTWDNELYTYNEILNSVQIEESPTPTPYEQHLETQITANLPEGEFIGKINDIYKDTLKVEYNEEDGQYHLNLYKNIAKVVLDGNENWMLNNLNLTNTKVFSFSLNNKPLSNDTQYFKNTRFQKTSGWNTLTKTDEEMIQIYSDKTLYIRINNSRATDLNTFKTWLSTHNTEVYYVLATPYILDLGVVDMPITYNEITNLFTDSNLSLTINAKYYRNFISTVRNLQVNEKALKQELIDINTRLSALETAQTNVASESEVVE